MLCPPRLRSEYDRAARELEAELREDYPGGEPTLNIASEILYFHEKGIMSGAECLCRVRFDRAGMQVADAIVRSESKSFREGGSGALAEACVEAIGKFLRKCTPHEEEAQDAKD